MMKRGHRTGRTVRAWGGSWDAGGGGGADPPCPSADIRTNTGNIIFLLLFSPGKKRGCRLGASVGAHVPTDSELIISLL